ncbi:hypothetical protein HPB47_021200 [Ixodes persulcatus]|uniref:Uncharacterized protein n=1 Tax=Ixodes persulcatus TaxID=34615 RepID=A0AC60QD94_IXOPE|nr:hypothetical protein HPB47_021200 [Ixodes persulcatus]
MGKPEDKTNFSRVSAKLRRHAKVLVRNQRKLMDNDFENSYKTDLARAAKETPVPAAERLCALYAPAEASRSPAIPNTVSGPLDTYFTVQELQSALRKCRKKSAARLDGVLYQALTHLTEEAKDALVKRFKAIYNTRDVPNGWKAAMTIPLLKAGNYRQ